MQVGAEERTSVLADALGILAVESLVPLYHVPEVVVPEAVMNEVARAPADDLSARTCACERIGARRLDRRGLGLGISR